MNKEVKALLDAYNIIGESLVDITERPAVARNGLGALMVSIKGILASHDINVGPVTSYNNGAEPAEITPCERIDMCDHDATMQCGSCFNFCNFKSA